MSNGTGWFDRNAIFAALDKMRVSRKLDSWQLADIMDKSLELNGLSFQDLCALFQVETEEDCETLFSTARRIKEKIYGRRIVLFAPLYISNLCNNECLYCAFRRSNTLLTRRALNGEEIQNETRVILDQGHKRILLVAGEAYPKDDGFSYVIKAIESIYTTRNAQGDSIRRVNANVAPLTVERFRELKDVGIGTYQLFQETYHHLTYAAVHKAGKKSDFDWRLNGMDRAMQAGIDDVGIGVLLGLSHWRFELLALIHHAQHLEKEFGVGCHTISVPRIEPAVGSDMASAPPSPVSDKDFKKLVAILRLAVPYTGLILSTREAPQVRDEVISLGVSQISAGSCTDPGGYAADRNESAAQFTLGDHRSLAEMVDSLGNSGFIPSFCTACYRTNRTGHDFMELAKPGAIKAKCGPNALASYLEYLQHYTQESTLSAGRHLIEDELSAMPQKVRERTLGMLKKVEQGQRDVFC